MKLLNKCAIITGANQGFGLAVVEHFVKEGANVVLCARNEEKLKEVEKSFKDKLIRPSQLVCVKADISKPADNENLVKVAIANFGSIDILVANAGVYGP